MNMDQNMKLCFMNQIKALIKIKKKEKIKI